MITFRWPRFVDVGEGGLAHGGDDDGIVASIRFPGGALSACSRATPCASAPPPGSGLSRWQVGHALAAFDEAFLQLGAVPRNVVANLEGQLLAARGRARGAGGALRAMNSLESQRSCFLLEGA